MKAFQKYNKFFTSSFKDLGRTCPSDILTEDYFQRLTQYSLVLKTINQISEAAQAKRTPTGSRVVGWTSKLLKATAPSTSDSKPLADFKEALHKSFEKRIGRYISTVTNMLKASLFDVQEACKLESYGVKPALIKLAWENILDEGILLYDFKGIEETQAKTILRTSLEIVGSAIMKSPSVDNPLDFFRETYTANEFLAGSIQQIRPIAAMYLSFPSGAGEVERGFSGTKLTMTDLRNSMHEETLEDLTIIADYANQPHYSFTLLTTVIARILAQTNKQL